MENASVMRSVDRRTRRGESLWDEGPLPVADYGAIHQRLSRPKEPRIGHAASRDQQPFRVLETNMPATTVGPQGVRGHIDGAIHQQS
eukprot:scaffold279045_cov36-Tisochrysis_lutea.AAC.3